MLDTDLPRFTQAFTALATTFRLRMTSSSRDDLLATYFRVLREASLEAVLAAGDVCAKRSKRFPRPAEWLGALQQPGGVAALAPDVRVMSATEATALARAVALCYEDLACACLLCQAAGIDRPIRFVPDERADGTIERAYNQSRQKVEPTGHWAHGAELVAWYAARAAFYAAAGTLAPLVARALVSADVVVRSREPGEDDV